MSTSCPPSGVFSNTASGAFVIWEPAKSTNWNQISTTLFQYYLSACLLIVGVISFYDAYLVVYFRETIQSVEKNPICLELIKWDPEYLSWFIAFKALGTIGVLGSMFGIAKYKSSYGVIVSTALALFQIGLLYYLHNADSIKGEPYFWFPGL